MSCEELLKNLTDHSSKYQAKAFPWQQKLYLRTEMVCGILLPIIFTFGIIGNILNMIVLTRKRLRGRLNVMERSAIVGLFGLALSDLLFCVTGFVEPFVKSKPPSFGFMKNTAWIVKMDNMMNGLMNTFLLISTWIVVYFSVERFIGVRFPIWAREIVSLTRTTIAIVCIYALAASINIPLFMKYEAHEMQCALKCKCYHTRLTPLFRGAFPKIYHIVWGILGTFLPLVALLICNIMIGLIILRRRRHEGLHYNREAMDSAMRATTILFCVVILYFTLVCPSMILQFFTVLLPNKSEDHGPAYIYRTIQVITNLTQGLNFSINFVLYCTISRGFRDAFRYAITCRRESSKSTSIRHTHVTCENTQALYPLVTIKPTV